MHPDAMTKAPMPGGTVKRGDTPLELFDRAIEELAAVVHHIGDVTEPIRTHTPEVTEAEMERPENNHSILSRVDKLNQLTNRLSYLARTVDL